MMNHSLKMVGMQQGGLMASRSAGRPMGGSGSVNRRVFYSLARRVHPLGLHRLSTDGCSPLS